MSTIATVTTSYTAEDTGSSLIGARLSKYRLAHWLCDILRNLLCDPVNIKDERLHALLESVDWAQRDNKRGLLRIEPPFSKDTRKACTTPAILVTAGNTKYPFVPINNGVNPDRSGMYKRSVCRSIGASIAVLTESADGTCLLSDTIEDFLVINSLPLTKDGMVSQFIVQGSSAVTRLAAGEAANAKDLYQIVISVEVTGGLSWTSDTQGPLFRGLSGQPSA